MNKKIYLASPHMSDEGYEQEYVKEAFDTNWIAPLGENVNKFEEELASYVGTKYAAALSAGTAAIHMAFKALDVKEGDIVFCSSLTFSATANPITYQNATPVFIDSEPETWNMDPKALEKAFEKYPHPKAVIVVHLYGTPAKIEEIKAICDKHGVPLVEDAAESLGSTYKGKETGTFGKYGIYSFNGNKIITTSGGGMLVSEDEEKIEKVRFWSTQSREKARHYEHKEIGYNYRMSNIVAGIGRGQLKVIDLRIKQKTDIYNRYKEAFKQIPDIEMQPTPVDTVPNHWLSVITLKANSKVKPLDIMEALEKENIESRPVWKPMHMQPVFAKCDFIKVADKAVSEDLFTRGVCLPSDTKMTEEEHENGNLLLDSERLTKFGKVLRSTSLDELPELVNILKGDMSIVGPRPLLIRDMLFMTDEQRKRHNVRQGLTGLAQINGRNNITWEEKLEYDLQYIKNITFVEDMKIIFKTVLKVLKRDDINTDGMDTAEDLCDYLLRTNKITEKEYKEKLRTQVKL